MPESKLNRITDAEPADSRWNWLYRLGGAGALLTVALLPIQIGVFIAWPPPGFQPTSSAVIGHFAVLHHHALLGLINLDLLLIVDQVLAIPIALALYIVLRRASESFMLLATALSLVAITAYLASNTNFSLLSLSDQYAAATTDAGRSLIVAAGLALMAIYTGAAFRVSYFLGSIAMIMVAVVMLRSNIFSRLIAWVGILASVIGLGLFVPRIGLYLAFLSLPFLVIWDILIARRLFQLGRGKPDGTAEP
ncbi:MAG TPA: DUF4386 family protein [Terriglobia bacterium]|nr:DUF4386 family protein [Terriglobia bacterium]